MDPWKIYFITITCILPVSAASFNPNVTVKVCSSTELVVRLVNASEGGIIYIQGKGSACRQMTYEEPRDYYFDITSCSIDFDTTFRIIVQERPDVQTGLDKVIPVMCILDMSEIIVGNNFIPVDVLNDGQNKTVKPTATMKILLNNSDVSGGSVTLSDPLQMTLELDDEFKDDFDLKAKDCTAAFRKIIDDECAPDRELFPDFERQSKGKLITDFSAFQPTDLTGDAEAEIAYTCTVSVCKGNCQQTVCDTIVGWGRKKRSRQLDEEIEDLTIGTTVTVLSPVQMQSKHEGKAEICIEKISMLAIAIVSGILVMSSILFTGYLIKRLHAAEGKVDMSVVERAKAAGRRLSTILNIPTTYDLKAKDQKHFQQIPEEEYSPEQVRKPVQVKNVEYLKE